MKNLTILNTGCGLGDMLSRIDAVFKYAKKYNHKFHIPSISSNLHNQNYDQILGFETIKPRAEEWSGETVTIDLENLDDEITKIDNNKLIIIKYNHSYSRKFIAEHSLNQLSGFNYKPYINIADQEKQKGIDFLIHLRLGDNYIYKLQNNHYLDSGRRRIIENLEDIKNEYQRQWTINQVASTIDILEKNKSSYVIHCDGIESGLRHVRWSKDEAYKKEFELLISAIQEFEINFKKQIASRSKFVSFGETDIRKPIIDLLNCKTLVYTIGGFMGNVNKLLNPEPAKAIHFSEFLTTLQN